MKLITRFLQSDEFSSSSQKTLGFYRFVGWEAHPVSDDEAGDYYLSYGMNAIGSFVKGFALMLL